MPKNSFPAWKVINFPFWSSASCSCSFIVIDVKSTVVGLIVEKIAEVDTIMDDDIVPPPTLGRKDNEQNKYVYGLAKTEDSVKLSISLFMEAIHSVR